MIGNAQSLVEAGFQVLVLSGQRSTDAQVHHFKDGIFLASTSERDAEHLPDFLKYASYALMGLKSRKWLEQRQVLPAAIILYSGYLPYILQFRRWSRCIGIPLLFDAVEWYSSASRLGFLASPYLWQTDAAMRLLLPRLDGLIVISRYLEAYYGRCGIPVARVPPTLDVAATPIGLGSQSGRVSLVYAGSPGRKDLLSVLLQAIAKTDPDGRLINVDLYGLNEEELTRIQPKGWPPAVKVRGRVTQAEAMAAVGRADFSVIVRMHDRVANAGFPTKLVESLAVGTPVIANLTGDIGDHLVDGVNGLVCKAPHADALASTLRRALTLSPEARSAMRVGARATAEANFDYGRHVGRLADVIARASARSVAAEPNRVGK